MKNNKNKDNILYMYFPALGISLVTLLILSLVSSMIIYAGENPTSNIGIASLATLISSAAVSGIIISRYKGNEGMKVAGLSSLATVLIMLIIGVILSGGKFSPSAFINYGCYVGISLLAAYLGRKRGKRRRR